MLLFVIICFTFWDSIDSQCPFTSRTFLNNGSLADIYVENVSKICDEARPSGIVDRCSAGLINAFFSPTLILPNGTNVWPYIDLNVTVMANVFVTDVFVQLECLHATNTENVYCHNHSKLMDQWGRVVWPCRQYSVKNKKDEIKLPFVFEQSCFRMHGMSQYRMNVTIKPQNCVLSYLVTMPMDKQVEPRIAKFFSDDKEGEISKYPWSPMITMDDNEDDGIWIRFARKPPGLTADVTVGIFEVISGIASKKVIMEDLSAPKSEIKVNIPRGEYLAFVFVDDPNCKFQCPENEEIHCSVCPHTSLNFTLNTHKLGGLQNAWHVFVKIAKYFFFVIVGLLFVGFLIVTGLYIYVHIVRPRRLARLPPQSVEMTARPDVLIIYTDDCPQHTSVITALAELLQSHANAKVRIDIFDLNDPSVKPSMWLLNAISEAQFVLIIFSDSSPRVMAGDCLIPRRPFPEMFNSAVGMIIAEINEITTREGIRTSNGRPGNQQRANSNSALSKFLVARLVYSESSCIPEFFNLLPCKNLVFPRDLGLLFGYLHGVDVANTNSLEHDADLTSLNQAIQRYQQFIYLHPNWLDLRFETRQSNDIQLSDVRDVASNLPTRNDIPQPSVEEIAAKYNLELPDEHENDLENKGDSEKFKLIGNLDDVSTSSASD